MNKTYEKGVVLNAQNLSKSFLEPPNQVNVLQDVNLKVYAGDSVAILGASGSGKSTLLHLLGGLDSPSQGSVSLMGEDYSGMPERLRDLSRNKSLGFVYQFHHLLQEFDALHNVAMPLLIQRMERKLALSRAERVLASVGLASRVSHSPSELSGGERQRVAIARALVVEPKCLLADEPTGNLDRSTASQVFDLMLHLSAAQSMSLIMVTHDESLAARCTRRFKLKEGRLEQET
jgi:lipoprotein-releasing system ATP-binding protein